MELPTEIVEKCERLTLSLVLKDWGNLSYKEVYEAIENYAEANLFTNWVELSFLDIYDDLSVTDPYFIIETIDNIYRSLVEVATFSKGLTNE